MIFDSPFSLLQLLGQLSVFPAWVTKTEMISVANNDCLYSLTKILKSSHLLDVLYMQTLTLLHAFDEAVILGHGGGRVFDPLWDL